MRRSVVVVLCLAGAALLLASCGGGKPAATKSTGGGAFPVEPTAVVASVNGEKITGADLEKTVKGQLLELERQRLEQEHQILSQALDGMIAKKLVLAEAAKRSITEEELLRTEIAAKVTPPTDAEVKAFYDQHQREIQRPWDDQVKEALRTYALRDKQQKAVMAFITGLRSAAKVDVSLPPAELPFVEVAAVGPARGPAQAPVTIVIFSDFQCPYCSRAVPVLEEIRKTYGDKVRLVFRDYPLPIHPLAPKAAEAGHCADEQGKFWEMHDEMFKHQDKLGVDDLKADARKIGLDGKKFDECLDSGRMKAAVSENAAAAQAAGVDSTPAFFINGRLVSGAEPFDAFKQVIDRELKRAGA